MSSTISSARTAAQRIALGSSRCRRYASTEAVPAPPAVVPVPPPSTVAGKRKPTQSHLSQELHKAIFPNFYRPDGRPKNPHRYKEEKQRKRIDPEWRQTLKKKNVAMGLSTYTSYSQPCTVYDSNGMYDRGQETNVPQASDTVSPFSNHQPSTSRRSAPTPLQP